MRYIRIVVMRLLLDNSIIYFKNGLELLLESWKALLLSSHITLPSPSANYYISISSPRQRSMHHHATLDYFLFRLLLTLMHHIMSTMPYPLLSSPCQICRKNRPSIPLKSRIIDSLLGFISIADSEL